MLGEMFPEKTRFVQTLLWGGVHAAAQISRTGFSLPNDNCQAKYCLEYGSY